MARVKVYRVRVYNVNNDEWQYSRRLMTVAGAALAGATIVEGSEIEIDASDLVPGEQWTDRNFDPHRGSGFPTQVKP